MSRITVDTSALLAILQGEPDAEVFEDCLFRAKGSASMSAASYLESLIVIEARAPEAGVSDLRTLADAFSLTITPVTQATAELAFRAFTRFGKGRHPAALNFGDCFSYALSKEIGAPLLFKGNDFLQTDVASALEELR